MGSVVMDAVQRERYALTCGIILQFNATFVATRLQIISLLLIIYYYIYNNMKDFCVQFFFIIDL